MLGDAVFVFYDGAAPFENQGFVVCVSQDVKDVELGEESIS